MRHLMAAFCAFALLAGLGLRPDLALAQSGTPAQALTTCGSPNNSPVNGSYYSLTTDLKSQLCVNLSGSGSVVISPATHAQTSALASNLVAKAAAGTLYSFNVSADTTLNASTWYVMIFDAASLPADGAVTPAKCYAMPAGAPTASGLFGAGGVTFSSGIVIGVSTTGCFTKTASTHALFIGADYQ